MKQLVDKWREQADRDDMSECEADAIGEPEFDKCAVFHKHRAETLRKCADELEAALKAGGAPAEKKEVCPKCDYEYPRLRTDESYKCDECGFVWPEQPSDVL